ncbi:hypothetical protein NLU13_1216 [Sarocladium strictum]|uniref:MARVEL domain-containing protein n=1 Tax=Sarocladium strictum TaxID=5046 RepID=A0AA39GQJ4_SARSR|nr:hypothetical protein NLU13_1216 [Sarocladium strictum]
MNAPLEKTISDDHVLKTPIWITVIRGFQLFISLVIVGLAGRLMHDAYLDEHGLALAIGIITWIAVGYILITEKIPSCRHAYHIVAVLSLDAVFTILWLATFAAVAARRAQFTVDVSVSNCFDDGSLVDSKTCFRKRSLFKRAVILFRTGAAMMAANAGLGALVWILFIVTLVWTSIQFHRGRKQGRFPMGSSSSKPNGPDAATVEHFQMEPKPVDPSQQPQQQQQAAYPTQQQPTVMHNQPPHGQFPPPAGTYPQGVYQQAVSPSSAQGPYSPPAPGYPQDQQAYNQYAQQQQQQHYPQQQGYPQHQHQQPFQPPTSPSPIAQTNESVTVHSQSPPPQELPPQQYPAAPQEMPSTPYHAPPNQQSQQ